MKTTFQLKQELRDMEAEIAKRSESIIDFATKGESKEVSRLDEEIKGLETCRNALKVEIEKREAAATQQAKTIELETKSLDPKLEETRAKAEFYRNIFKGEPVSQETRNLLGAIGQTVATGGEKFLPANLANTLISEPFTKNPLRNIIVVTNIKGLELPKIAYTLDDDGFISDEKVAKEIALTGDKVTFGRNKFKVKARISDSVMHGSDLDLVNYVENALQSGLAAKEKKIALAATPAAGEEAMNFYSTVNGLKKLEAADKYKAIKAAIADLHEDFRENAGILMAYADYMDIIEMLANNNKTLYDAQPEKVLGKPVTFCDLAVNPIVGDFRYAHLNYDGSLVYDTDKDVDKGEYLFVLTGWLDMKIKLKSAFRIATKKAGTTT